MDLGIKECEFWDMSLDEVIRAVESKKRVQLEKAKERASFDYILADLIGKSISRLYSSSGRMPSIQEVYPALFNDEKTQEDIQAQKDELSAIRFKQFAQSYNKRFDKEANN
jgi:hypothetical protein